MYSRVLNEPDLVLKLSDSDRTACLSSMDQIACTPTQSFTQYLGCLLRSKDKGFCFEASLKAIQLVMKCKLSGKEAGDAIACVGEHLPLCSEKAQLNLLREIMDGLETETKHDGVVFEILGRILSRQTAKEDVGAIDFDGETFSSPGEFRAKIVTMLTAATWSPSYTVNLMGVFKDALLAESEQKQLCDKGLFMLGQVDYAVLPSLVYQLLLFKYKNKGEVIVKIAEFFEGHEAKARAGKLPPAKVERLRQIEGTVLLHVDVALKQDSSLATSFLKTLQKESYTRSTFMTAFLLALSRSPRHQDAVMKLLMAMVTSGVEEDVLSSSHAWANGALKHGERPAGAVKAILFETAERAQNGWQVVIQPLMNLALAAMENKSRNKHLADLLRTLGSEVLEVVFRLHESVQGEILSHIFARIASTGSETPAFVHLLAVLVSKFKHQVMQSELKLREAFEYLTYLKPSVGLQLVDAILPLMTGTKAFQDHLMIVFRKAMFRGDLQSRLTAVGGFARWITFDKLEQDVAYDILGFLHRALTQQREVRVVVYGCLEELISKQPESVRLVLDMLTDQLSRYLPENAAKINLKSCLEGDTVTEPLGLLISTAQRCAKLGMANNGPETSAWKRCQLLLSRVKAIVNIAQDADLSDFDLDKSSDFSDSSVSARANLLLSLYVACTETMVGGAEEKMLSEKTAKQVSQVFQKYSELLEAMQKKSEENDGGEKKKRKGAVAAASAAAAAVGGGDGAATGPLSTKQVSEQLIGIKEMHLLLEGVAREKQDNVSQLIRDNKLLHRWIVARALHLVTVELDEEVHVADAQVLESRLEFCATMGALLMAEYKRDNEKEISHPLAEALLIVIEFFTKNNDSQAKLAEFLEKINRMNKGAAKDSQTLLQDHVRSILSFVSPLMQAKNFKEMLIVFRMCKALIQHLKPENLNNLQRTTTDLLSTPLENTVAVNALVELYLEICEKNKSGKLGAELLIQDLQLKFGTVDDIEGNRQTLGVTGEKTWSAVGLLALGVVERLVHETEWSLAILKGTDAASPSFDGERLRELTYHKLSDAIALLDNMSRVQLPLGPVKDSTLRLATRAFKVLYNMVKTFTKQKHIPSDSFGVLIKNVGTLIGHLYPLMIRNEDAESDGEEKPKSKKQKNQAVAQAKKDERIQPALVFEIEHLETSLIKFQKQCKMTLMFNWTRSVERGYQVDLKKISTIVQKRSERENNEEEEEQQEEGQGSKKRQKKGGSKKKKKNTDPDVEDSPAAPQEEEEEEQPKSKQKRGRPVKGEKAKTVKKTKAREQD